METAAFGQNCSRECRSRRRKVCAGHREYAEDRSLLSFLEESKGQNQGLENIYRVKRD